MTSVPAPIAVLLQPLKADLDRYGVRGLYLFGSRARGDARPDSDWDFVAEFVSPPDFDQFMAVRDLLEERLRGPVDLLSRTACPPRLWKSIEPELLHAA
ncbi:MAG TPA: nucleotidyltransferase domain-containing protein [Opitutaceae bacterium]|nr:nucleotidyltransferase domain-containing protein [Opitutaceae bacterium]